MRSLGKATAAIPVLRRGFAQTLRVGSKNFTEQFMLDGHAPPLAFSKARRQGSVLSHTRREVLTLLRMLDLRMTEIFG